jgi:hypothetical protein
LLQTEATTVPRASGVSGGCGLRYSSLSDDNLL